MEHDDNDTAWTLTERLEREALLEPQTWMPLVHGDQDIRPVVGVPMERTISQEAFFGFVNIFQRGWSMAQHPYARNDLTRHHMVKFLLEHEEYTHLVMLDSDHVHPPDIVERLARWVRAYPERVEVIGGLNFRRGEPFDPCAFVDPGDGQFHRMEDWARYPDGHPMAGRPSSAIAVEALGTGSIMIARTAIEKLADDEAWFDYKYPDHKGWPGTDMTFSSRCRQAGITLWVDTTTTSPHLTTMRVDEQTYRDWVAWKRAQINANKEPEPVGEVVLR